MATYQSSAMHRLRIRRIKRAITTVFGIALCALAGFAGYTFANSSFFDISEIAITGNRTVSRDEIISLAKIRYGTNILRCSGSQVAQRLKVQPYIESAEVSRVFPSKIEIRVKERTPMALINADDRYFILDENGYCLTEVGVATAESWVLPGIRCNPRVASLTPGERSDDTGAQAALSLIKRLDPYFIENIYEIDAPSAEKLSLVNREGLRVFFGQAEDLDRKLRDYEDVLIKNAEICNADTLEYVDLRYDTQVTLKWK